MRIDLDHVDKATEKPYTDPKTAGPHHHGYEPDGKTIVLESEDKNLHVPTQA